MQSYLPVKVIKKEYAEEMINGRIKMSPLADFGGYNNTCDDKDAGRADSTEGLIYNVSPNEPDPFFSALPAGLRSVIKCSYYISEVDKYAHLFCMYRLFYDLDTQSFEKMDPRMLKMGDSAVIILRPDLFYERLSRWVSATYHNKYVSAVGDISYKSLYKDYGIWGVFAKDEKDYSYQNEVRIAAIINPRLSVHRERSEDITPWFTDLGDISDIVRVLPAKDLVNHPLSIHTLDKETLNILKKSSPIPTGLIKERIILQGRFGAVYPSKDVINKWQKFFTEKEWRPISEMNNMAPDGSVCPGVSFFNRINHTQAVHIFSNILFIEGIEDATQVISGLLDVLEDDCQSSIDVFSLEHRYNLGIISNQFYEYREKATYFDRDVSSNHRKYREIVELKIDLNYYRMIWGLSKQYRYCLYTHVLQTEVEKSDSTTICRILDEMQKIIRERFDEIRGRDIHEQFLDI